MSSESNKQEVRVTDIQMPFGSMVVFMVKWAVASIPALIILLVLGALFWGFLIGFFGSLTSPSRKVSSSPSSAGGGSLSEPQPNSEQSAYLSNILVGKIHVGEDVLGRTGVFGEVKNSGDRTLKKVEITIYCLGPDGKPVFEKTYTPVLVSEVSVSDSNQPLKPGYSRQFGVKMDDAPSEWTKQVEVKVTQAEFQ
jgi:hypothetical protein